MITEELYLYAAEHTTPETTVLARLNRETHLSQVYPQMLSGPLQGVFLRMVSQMMRPSRILEIGTFTGYSAINLAMGLKPEPGSGSGDGRGVLHTIEVNPEQEDMIRMFIREAGLEEKIVLHIGLAIEIIPMLDEVWDLVFIDADKPNYLNYYQMILPCLRQGGIIIADNVLWAGKVTGDPAKMDKDTRGICQFNEFVQNDGRVENILLPFRDGLMILRKL